MLPHGARIRNLDTEELLVVPENLKLDERRLPPQPYREAV
jgi:hypothetical protein